MRMRTRFVQWTVITVVMIGARLAEAEDAAIKTFLSSYCTECHGAEKQKGDRRFDQLSLPVSNADALLDLQDIVDQLNLGDMPPKKAKRKPGTKEVQAIIEHLTPLIADASERLSSTGGKTVLRRLNRREYLNTIGDLFGLNMSMSDPTVTFPGDQTVMHMDNNGDALRTSGYLLDQYIDAADQVVEKVFRLQERPPEQTWTFKDHSRQAQPVSNRYGVNPEVLRLYTGPNAVTHIGEYAPILEFAEGVPADGFYEIKVQAEG